MFSNWQLADELLNTNVDKWSWTTNVQFLRGNLQYRGEAFMLTVCLPNALKNKVFCLTYMVQWYAIRWNTAESIRTVLGGLTQLT
jgi:hypothetical protein